MNLWQRTRVLLVAALLCAAVVATWRATAGDRRAALAPSATLTELVTAVAGVVVLGALGWLSLLVLLLAIEGPDDRRLTARAGCPPALRRLLLVVCGVAAAGAMTLPAQAAGSDHDDHGATAGGLAGHQTSALLDGLPMPGRPLGATPADSVLVPAADRTGTETGTGTARSPGSDHVVRHGDSLWAIARDRLPPGSSAADVAHAWRAIYAANHRAVGDDPDLILPGTDLQIPSTDTLEQP